MLAPLRRKQQRRPFAHQRMLRAEALEDRRMLALVTVDTTADVVDFTGAQSIADLPGPDNLISLREAIIATNNTLGIDDIALSVSINSVFDLTDGELEITDSLNINTAFPVPVEIDAQGFSRIFEIYDGDTYTASSINLSNLTLTGGASSDGGAIRNTGEELTISDSILIGNTAMLAVQQSDGGAIFNSGHLTISSSILSGNSANDSGGAIYGAGGSLTIIDCTIDNNSSSYFGGGIFNRGLSPLQLVDSTVLGNYAIRGGGGVANWDSFLTIDGTAFAGNITGLGYGGGGLYHSNSQATIANSVFSGNATTLSSGGAIVNRYGYLTLESSLLYGNSAGQAGGGIYSRTSSFSSQHTLISQSTISGNTAGDGGGVLNVLGRTNIHNSTITLNDSSNTAGAASVGDSYTETVVASSIISGNVNGHDVRSTGVNSFNSQGYNVIGTDDSGNPNPFTAPGDQIGILDPGLMPLDYNGGLTRTHAIISGVSPAEDMGANSYGFLYDQRGFPYLRVGGADPDVGAFEYHYDDHGDTPNEATLLGANTNVFGQIELATDEDWFTFFVEDGTTLTLETGLFGLPNSTLELIDSDGITVLASNDDIGVGNYASRIQDFTITGTGQYYAVVRGAGFDTGAYELTLTHDDDHADDSLLATHVAFGATEAGIIEVNGDSDWFAFDAVMGEVYALVTTVGTLFDNVMMLYDTDGTTLLASDDDSGQGYAAAMAWAAPASGTYFIEVHSIGNNIDVGSYDLTIGEQLPDLWAVNLDADDGGDNMVETGETIDVYIDYENTGFLSVAGANYDVGLYLSHDATIDPAVDVNIYAQPGADLAPTVGVIDTIPVTLPDGSDPFWNGSGTYYLGMYVDDLFGVVEFNETNNWDSEALTVTVISPNVAPVADAGTDQTTSIFLPLTLDGSNSFDPDGGPGPLNYSWSVVSGPGTGSFGDASAAVTSFAADTPGVYEVELQVDDGLDFGIDTAFITFEPNVAPVAVAGPNVSTGVNVPILLDGSGSFDPDGGPLPLVFDWQVLNGPGFTVISNPGSATPDFTADTAGIYVVQLTVDDGELNHTDFVEVMVNATTPDGDFDMDDDWDCMDVDALVVEIVAGTNNVAFDLTGDTLVTAADLDQWLVLAGAAPGSPTGGNPFLPGDANLDAIVDGQDFLNWNDNKFTPTSAWCLGDFNADGVTDGQDFLIWNDNKFTSADDYSSLGTTEKASPRPSRTPDVKVTTLGSVRPFLPHAPRVVTFDDRPQIFARGRDRNECTNSQSVENGRWPGSVDDFFALMPRIRG